MMVPNPQAQRHHSLADVAVCGCTIVTGPNLAQYEVCFTRSIVSP